MREDFLPLLGSWTGLERQEASPWAPAADTRASLVLALAVADTVVVQDYRQVRDDGAEFTAHGVFQADPATGAVQWWLFDSYGQPPVAATGGWVDGTLVLEKTTATGTARHRFTPVAAAPEGEGPEEQQVDQLDYEIALRLGPAADWTPFLRGRYRRISGH